MNKAGSQAIDELCSHRVGSVLVLEGCDAVGILTERDILKIVQRHGDGIDTAPVTEFMTRDVVCSTVDDDLDYVMATMTKNRFRHLPVVDEDCVVGMVSIGDVVKAAKSEREYENRLLREYISGTYA